MKRLVMLVVSLVWVSSLFAQQATKLEYTSLQKAIEKSDAAIKDEKKNIKAKTWFDRGSVFQDAYEVNTKVVYAEMEQTNAMLLAGQPNQKVPKTIEGVEYEEWVYERLLLYFQGGKLKMWKETAPLHANPLNEALNSYLKAQELDVEKKLTKDIKKQLERLNEQFIRQGVDAYTWKDYTKAYKSFEQSLKVAENEVINKVDTAVIFNTALAAYHAKDYVTSIEYYKKAMVYGYKGAETYIYLVESARSNGDTDLAVKMLQEGRIKYPDDSRLIIELINHYLNTSDTENALQYLNMAIEKDAANATYYFARGTVFERKQVIEEEKVKKELENNVAKANLELDQLREEFKKNTNPKARAANTEKQEKVKAEIAKYDTKLVTPESDVSVALNIQAEESYKKSLENDKEQFNANYNLGVLYYNRAVLQYKRASKIPPEDNVAYEAATEKAKEWLRLSLPYMEKSHQINPKDMPSMQNLSTIYLRLQMYDKQKEIKEKLNNQ